MKVNNFRGALVAISTKTKALLQTDFTGPYECSCFQSDTKYCWDTSSHTSETSIEKIKKHAG